MALLREQLNAAVVDDTDASRANAHKNDLPFRRIVFVLEMFKGLAFEHSGESDR